MSNMSTAHEKIQEWLDSQQDDLESIAESSVVDSEYTFTEQEDDDDDDDDNETGEEISTVALGTRSIGESGESAQIVYTIRYNNTCICLLMHTLGSHQQSLHDERSPTRAD